MQRPDVNLYSDFEAFPVALIFPTRPKVRIRTHHLRLSMTALLPLEVIEHIVDECALCHKSLYNLSLSSRELLPRAHRHLFHSVKLLDASNLYAFDQALHTKPHLRRSIQTVTFYETYGEKESRALLGLVPAALLTRLPNLRRWVVKSRKRSNHEEPLWISFRHLSLVCLRTCSHHIETLDLHGVSFCTCSEFVMYVSAFPQIRTLSCTRIQVKEALLTNDAIVNRLSHRPRLQNLLVRILPTVTPHHADERITGEGGSATWPFIPRRRIGVLQSGAPLF